MCVAFGQSVAAQPLDPIPSQPIAMWVTPVVIDDGAGDTEALAAWIREYHAWQEWNAKWGNRRQWIPHPFPYPFWKESPDIFSYVAPRKLEPAPPVWLGDTCAGRPNGTVEPDVRTEGCRLLTVWKDDYVTHQLRVATATARAQRDDTGRSRFLEHIHFSGLWTNVDAGGATGRVYGLAGVHATIDVYGRWQIYALPGVVAVSVPNLQGSRTVTIGYDWGMAFRLFNLRIPVIDMPVKAHLNLAHVWMPEVHQKINMAGLSFTVNRNR